MKVLITGANGFLGKNLAAHLAERGDVDILPFTRADDISRLGEMVSVVDFVFHFAGVNRPENANEFETGNTRLTSALCDAIGACDKKISVLYTSSVQAGNETPYGKSKLGAEGSLEKLSGSHGTPIHIYRLPNVFGKWSRPDYNSVVATFCHNITRDLAVKIDDPAAVIALVYIDDVVKEFIDVMDRRPGISTFGMVEPQYSISVGELAEQLRSFRESRNTLVTDAVGTGLVRALYSTYVSYLPPESFSYQVQKHGDQRGVFVEMLKTRDSGQFSFFTAHPGVTRGGHYHHTKTEKFLVIKGKARFRFRNIVTNDYYEHFASGDAPEIVESVPGWSHDITNTGEGELLVMLWANEIFDIENPDTFNAPVTRFA